MKNRVEITSSCRDCDILEKHEKAGQLEMDTDGDKVQYMFNGVKIIYGTYHSPWMNTIIENLNGHHEPQEELCFYYVLKTLDQKANMLELGSNWSYYSIWFNKFINDPTNICIEPINTNIINGKKNSKKNGCDNMKFIKGCIGETYKENINFKNWNGDIITMNQYSIEKLINDSNIFFDVVHSDIQGAELSMLEGSINVLSKIGYFIISTHGNIHNKCLTFLKNNNFKILISHTLKESYSGDGLIVAINLHNSNKYEKIINGDIGNFFNNNCKISKR